MMKLRTSFCSLLSSIITIGDEQEFFENRLFNIDEKTLNVPAKYFSDKESP